MVVTMNRRLSHGLALLTACTLLLVCSVTHADTTAKVSTRPVYRLSWPLDGPWVGLTTVFAGGWLLHDELTTAHCAPRCDRADVAWFDKPFAGRFNEDWRVVGNVGVVTAIVGMGGSLLVEEGVGAGLNDIVVVAEAVLTANALSTLANVAFRRPRPLLYGDTASENERMNGRASLSFFSGHTANAYAATWAAFSTLRQRKDRGAFAWFVLGSGLAVSTLVGASRVASGDHFLSDVVAGAIAGSAVGVLVPWLHPKYAYSGAASSFALSVQSNAAMLAWRGAW